MSLLDCKTTLRASFHHDILNKTNDEERKHKKRDVHKIDIYSVKSNRKTSFKLNLTSTQMDWSIMHHKKYRMKPISIGVLISVFFLLYGICRKGWGICQSICCFSLKGLSSLHVSFIDEHIMFWWELCPTLEQLLIVQYEIGLNFCMCGPKCFILKDISWPLNLLWDMIMFMTCKQNRQPCCTQVKWFQITSRIFCFWGYLILPLVVPLLFSLKNYLCFYEIITKRRARDWYCMHFGGLHQTSIDWKLIWTEFCFRSYERILKIETKTQKVKEEF